MESAKAAVSNSLRKAGHHDTAVDETVQPAVNFRKYETYEARENYSNVDREIHQDHYHTTVQSLQEQEVLPEKHVQSELPVEERVFEDCTEEQTKQKLTAEAVRFKDTTSTAPTQSTRSELPVATGEHVHPHVHEAWVNPSLFKPCYILSVQPVVHKETIGPEFVHTTVPIHETHIAPSEQNGMSFLPIRTLNEFKQGGRVTRMSEIRHEKYEGDPRPYNAKTQQQRELADADPRAHDGLHDLESIGPSRPGSPNAAAPCTSGAEWQERKAYLQI